VRLSRTRTETAVAVLLAAAALGAALDRVPALVRAAEASLDRPGESLAVSDMNPLKFFVSLDALQNARAAIPNGALYTVIVGNDPPLPGDDAIAIQPTIQFWLLPRRYTPQLRAARWVILYDRPVSTVRIRARKVIPLADNVNLLEVGR
jgi:hypothetical protein